MIREGKGKMPRKRYEIGTRFKRIWPLFWKPCLNCDNEFRLESGWQAVDIASGMKHDTFVCNACAATAHEARDRYGEWRRPALRFIRPKPKE